MESDTEDPVDQKTLDVRKQIKKISSGLTVRLKAAGYLIDATGQITDDSPTWSRYIGIYGSKILVKLKLKCVDHAVAYDIHCGGTEFGVIDTMSTDKFIDHLFLRLDRLLGPTPVVATIDPPVYEDLTSPMDPVIKPSA